VLATEGFLADVARNVAGNRLAVESLVPDGTDPHGFQPSPSDAARIADSQVLIVNGAGLDAYLDKLMSNVGGKRQVIEASAGLRPRSAKESELPPAEGEEVDPHFWLDPLSVVRYAENIRAGLEQADPEGGPAYAANATEYSDRLRELDGWIQQQVKAIPPERRLLVTNHETFGYFADRYGFRIVGTVLPGTGTGAMPSARDVADLSRRIKQTGARAIFLETGSSPQLARAIAREEGVKVVTDLHTHSLTDASGLAPTYIDMMRYNVRTIVDALR
jgi:ABC-type Zn uptake system ZnuABC Zn-binding protein ZnuA